MVVRWLIALGLVVAAWAFSWPARAAVAVLANRTEGNVAFTVIQPDGGQTQHRWAREEVVPVPVAPTVTVIFEDGGQSRRCVLQASGIYAFHTDGNKLNLFPYPLPGIPASRPAPTSPPDAQNAVCTIPVKILVDDKEPTVRRVWEKRYRERIAAASEILERYCFVRFYGSTHQGV